MSSIHLELLDKNRGEVFEALKIFREDAVLGGGTALCLQIAHRFSYDFDLFLPREITSRDFRILEKAFVLERVDLNTPDQLNVVTKSAVKVTLLYYPYERLFSDVQTESLSLISVKDLAADKAFTIGRRAAWRDYVDAYFLIKSYISISELISLAEKKFAKVFNAKLFLEQICYFEDLEPAPIDFVGDHPTNDEVKGFLIREAKIYTEKHILGRENVPA